jgi:polyhydroxyalkanoate synthesis regulator phasin
MDQETKEYLDRKLLSLTTRDDVEKMRQEMNASFHKWKEENKGQGTEWKQAIKTDMEQLIKSGEIVMDPLQETIGDGLQRMRVEFQSALDQFKLAMDSSLRQIQVTHFPEETKSKIALLRERVSTFHDLMKKVEENIVTIDGKIKGGFTEVKDELGSMIKFSYSDLEKKLVSLEARVKALEKMVLP